MLWNLWCHSSFLFASIPSFPQNLQDSSVLHQDGSRRNLKDVDSQFPGLWLFTAADYLVIFWSFLTYTTPFIFWRGCGDCGVTDSLRSFRPPPPQPPEEKAKLNRDSVMNGVTDVSSNRGSDMHSPNAIVLILFLCSILQHSFYNLPFWSSYFVGTYPSW